MNRTHHHTHHTHSNKTPVPMARSAEVLAVNRLLHQGIPLLDNDFDDLYVEGDMVHLGAPSHVTVIQ